MVEAYTSWYGTSQPNITHEIGNWLAITARNVNLTPGPASRVRSKTYKCNILVCLCFVLFDVCVCVWPNASNLCEQIVSLRIRATPHRHLHA